MDKQYKLANNLYAASLDCGEISIAAGYTYSFYLVFANTYNEDYMRKQALQLVMSGCENINIYGTFHNKWCSILEMTTQRIMRISNQRNTLRIKAWDSIADFSMALYNEQQTRSFVPHIIYLIYDDYVLCQEILKCIKM